MKARARESGCDASPEESRTSPNRALLFLVREDHHAGRRG